MTYKLNNEHTTRSGVSFKPAQQLELPRCLVREYTLLGSTSSQSVRLFSRSIVFLTSLSVSFTVSQSKDRTLGIAGVTPNKCPVPFQLSPDVMMSLRFKSPLLRL